mmetsp:Transcript_133761/g.257418  ORF Transcript_133761/g.257418 Transcript_133761/m.257418 type:complete len:108 (+) Transcript_133761:78-401(+)
MLPANLKDRDCRSYQEVDEEVQKSEPNQHLEQPPADGNGKGLLPLKATGRCDLFEKGILFLVNLIKSTLDLLETCARSHQWKSSDVDMHNIGLRLECAKLDEAILTL